MLLSGYINLNKLDKDKDVNEKGYAYISIGINEKIDGYGNNCSIWMNQTKEEREDGEPRKYIGNARIVFINPSENLEVAPKKEFVSNNAQNPASSAPAPKTESTSSDLPF